MRFLPAKFYERKIYFVNPVDLNDWESDSFEFYGLAVDGRKIYRVISMQGHAKRYDGDGFGFHGEDVERIWLVW